MADVLAPFTLEGSTRTSAPVYMMRVKLPRYVTRYCDIRGKWRYRFRRRGVDANINARIGSVEFATRYRELCAKVSRGKPAVYFMRAGDSIKIGVAKNPQARLLAVQTSQPHRVELLATAPGGIKQERAYHAMFAKHHIRGEWFKSAPEIEAEINRLAPQ